MKSVVYENKRHYPVDKLTKEQTELVSLDTTVNDAKALVSNTASKVNYTDDYINGILEETNPSLPYVFHNFEFAYDSVLRSTQTAYLAYYAGWTTQVKGFRGSLVTLYLRKDDTKYITENDTLVFSLFIPESTYDETRYPLELRWNGEDVSGFFQIKKDGTELYFECNNGYMIRRISVNKRDVLSEDQRTFRLVEKGEANRPQLDGLNKNLPNLNNIKDYCRTDWNSILPKGCYFVKDKPWLAVYGKQINSLPTQYKNEVTHTVDLAGLSSKDDSDLKLIYLPTMYEFQYLDSRGRTVEQYTYTKKDWFERFYSHFLFQNDYVIDYDNPKYNGNRSDDQNPKVDMVDLGYETIDLGEETDVHPTWYTGYPENERENLTGYFTIKHWQGNNWTNYSSNLTYQQVKQKYLQRIADYNLAQYTDNSEILTVFDKNISHREIHRSTIFDQTNTAFNIKQSQSNEDYFILRDSGYQYSFSKNGVRAIFDIKMKMSYTKLLRDSHILKEHVGLATTGPQGDRESFNVWRKTKYIQSKLLIDGFFTQIKFNRFEYEESAKETIKTEIILYNQNPCTASTTCPAFKASGSALYDEMFKEACKWFSEQFSNTDFSKPVLVEVDVTTLK